MDFLDNNIFKVVKNIIEILLLIIIIALEVLIIINKKDNTVISQEKSVALVTEEENSNNDCEIEKKEIAVDIKGAIVNPGVYRLEEGSIINDLIELAGGLTKKAVTKNLNLSKKLENEMVIYVYTNKELEIKKDEIKVDISSNIKKEECICNSYEITECEGSSIIVGNGEGSNSSEVVKDNDDTNSNEVVKDNNDKVNINIASKEELMTISGIGESKANSIIEYRNSNKFTSIEDIKNVSGIGDSLFARIKDYITV